MRFYILFLFFFSASSLASKDIPKAIWQAEKAVWEIYDGSQVGTGFFIGPQLFVTNLHVVLDSLNVENSLFKKIEISQKGQKSRIKLKKLINLSFTHDLAIFETNKKVSHYLKLPSNIPELTDSVFAIGYPNGLFQIAKNTNPNFLTNKHVMSGYFNSFNLNGISGSPVLNERGEIIGVAQSVGDNLLTAIRLIHLKNLIKSSEHKIRLSKRQSANIQSLIKEKLLEPNSAITQYTIGIIFNNFDKKLSEKYKQDPFQLFKKSAEGGYALAQFQLGKMFYYGKDTNQNFQKAVYWFAKAAKQDYAPAQSALGLMHYMREDIDYNFQKAVYWFELAAEQGFAPAQHSLGLMYYNGTKIKQNFKKAMHWFELAAKQNFASSQHYLGVMLYTKKGT